MRKITDIQIELPHVNIHIKDVLSEQTVFKNLRITTPSMRIEYWNNGDPHYAHIEYEDLIAAIKSYEARQKKRRRK